MQTITCNWTYTHSHILYIRYGYPSGSLNVWGLLFEIAGFVCESLELAFTLNSMELMRCRGRTVLQTSVRGPGQEHKNTKLLDCEVHRRHSRCKKRLASSILFSVSPASPASPASPTCPSRLSQPGQRRQASLADRA